MENNHYLWRWFKNDPRYFVAFFSVILSLVIYSQFYINPDGIYYLHAAQSILDHGFNADHHGLNWPFYPLLIAGLKAVSGFSLLSCSLFIQTLLQILLVISFINIIRLLGGNTTIQWLAAATVLLHPELNEYRGIIIRDFGYWAFLLTSFYWLLRYMQQPSWLSSALWLMSLVFAILFRIEGVVVMGLSPLLLLCAYQYTLTKRCMYALRLYTLMILIGLVGIGLVEIRAEGLLNLNRFDELTRWAYYLAGDFAQQWEEKQLMLVEHMRLLKFAHTSIFLIGGLIAYFIYQLIHTTQILFMVVIIVGQCRHYLARYCERWQLLVLYGFLAINLFIPVVFVTGRWFLASRFLMPSVLILLLWVPFVLYTAYQYIKDQQWITRYKRYLQVLLLLGILGFLIDSTISFNSPARVVKEGAAWIHKNVPADAKVYSNSPQLLFYADHPGIDLSQYPITSRLEKLMIKKPWKKGGYVAVFIKRKDNETEKLLTQQLGISPIERVRDARGYQVVIYKVLPV